MRQPFESLDDFKRSAAEKPAEPPRWVSVRPTGEFERLKPLARWEPPPKNLPIAGNILFTKPKAVVAAIRRRSNRSVQWSDWFRRQLTVRPAFIVLVTIAAATYYLAIFAPSAGQPDDLIGTVATLNDTMRDRPVENMLPPTDEPSNSELSFADSSPFDAPQISHPAARRRPAHPRIRIAYMEPQPDLQLAQPQSLITPAQPQPLRPPFWVSQFAPTTLVIYIADGEVKTRIEPWLPTGAKKALPN